MVGGGEGVGQGYCDKASLDREIVDRLWELAHEISVCKNMKEGKKIYKEEYRRLHKKLYELRKGEKPFTSFFEYERF